MKARDMDPATLRALAAELRASSRRLRVLAFGQRTEADASPIERMAAADEVLASKYARRATRAERAQKARTP